VALERAQDAQHTEGGLDLQRLLQAAVLAQAHVRPAVEIVAAAPALSEILARETI